MGTRPSAPLVAIVDMQEELAHLLALVLADEGFRTVSALVGDFERGRRDVGAFLSEFDPAVVVWDVSLPYEENWAFFRSVRNGQAAQGRQFVLTSTNKRALEALVGATGAYQIVGKPFDLNTISAAVRSAARTARRHREAAAPKPGRSTVVSPVLRRPRGGTGVSPTAGP